jgi:ATP-dependent exoDNAse (exonuclease V) beta subunit
LYPWPRRNTRENATMLYVEMTRAKEKVYLLSTTYSPTIKQIQEIISDLIKENIK